ATGLSCTNCASPFASPAATTTYIVTGNNSCFTSFDTIMVTVNPAVSASAFGGITVCPGDTVQLSASGGETYSWSPETGLDDPLSQNPLAVVTGNVTYTVLVSNQFGCTDTASVTVDVFFVPDITITPYPDTTIYLGNSVMLVATGASTYSWSPPLYLDDPNSSSPTSVLPQDTITYYLTFISAEGCVLIDSVTINVKWDALVLVPSAFSPNADGRNDLMRLIVRGIFTLDHFYIYNRWGQEVYSTGNLDEATQSGWDGKFKNTVQPAGVYVYLVTGADHEGKTVQLQGNFTLVR
ncbi:MAG: gliding motility-associated C-terminal domain-containing protein, partial [Chitinophagales bacterium]